jgi:hypothetical protein
MALHGRCVKNHDCPLLKQKLIIKNLAMFLILVKNWLLVTNFHGILCFVQFNLS